MHQSASKHVIFILKIKKNFWGGGTAPSQAPPQREGDTPASRTHPVGACGLRRLDLRAFGAHSRTPATRKSGYGPVA